MYAVKKIGEHGNGMFPWLSLPSQKGGYPGHGTHPERMPLKDAMALVDSMNEHTPNYCAVFSVRGFVKKQIYPK